MKNSLWDFIYFLFFFISALSESEGSEAIQEFINGKSERAEVSVVVDLSSRNLEAIKSFWNEQSITYKGKVSFGVIDGLGRESLTSLKNLKEVTQNIEELDTDGYSNNASGSDLFRYLLKIMSLIRPEGEILLFTGRATEEEPLQKSCIDKAKEKRCRVLVIWTGESTDSAEALRAVALASGGSMEMISVILEKNPEEIKETISAEMVMNHKLRLQSLEPVKEQSNTQSTGEVVTEDKDKTLKQMERVRFPEENPSANNLSHPSVNQQSRSAVIIPIKVEVDSGSTLQCSPGGRHSIIFEVKNNLHVPLILQFRAMQTQNIRIIYVQPDRQTLPPLETIKVDVTFESQSNIPEGGEGALTFAALTQQGGITPRSAIIYFSNKAVRDTLEPTVSYTYIGDCKGHDKPDTCDNGQWKFEATFQDETSGLKKVLSEPYGLTFKTPFTAGTKAPVSVFYTASCCQPKIQIWAEDGQGNYVRRSLDVNNQGLLAAEITAIVLGVLLLICVIFGIVLTIVIIRKRRQNKLIIPRYQSSS